MRIISPDNAEVLHAYATLLWALMIPIAIFFGLIASVAFISVISIYANFAGHFAAWQSSRVEVKQEDEIERQKNCEN